MTNHPVEESTGQSHYTYYHSTSRSDGLSDPLQSFGGTVNYAQRWAHRYGGNSPNWPSIKTNNSYFAAECKCKMEPVEFNFSIFHDPPSAVTSDNWYGSTWYPGINPSAPSPANDGEEGNKWPARPFALNAQRVTNKLLQNLNQSKVNAAQFLAEREQTKNLVASSARRIAESLLAVKRGNIKHAVTSLLGNKKSRGIGRVAGGVPEQWLALQYGWKPLLSDIYGSCEELAALATGVNPEVYTVNASVTTEIPPCSYLAGGDGDWFPPIRWETSGGRILGKGSITVTLGSNTINGLSRTGIVNPLTLGWELLPWSFVVDWFYPVGDFLSQCNAEDGLLFSRGWVSQKSSLSWRGKPSKSDYQNLPSKTFGRIFGAQCTAEVRDYSRSGLSGFPVASWPSFKDPFSSTHVANALSLLATAFGRGPRVR